MTIDYRTAFAEEPEGILDAWRNLTQATTPSKNVWTDAYLAAFAQAADFKIVTFDKGFANYNGVRCKILS